MIRVHQLEANIVRHCNNRCVACSHASAFMKSGYKMTPHQLLQDLQLLNPFIHADQFTILGGEPLLHPNLCELADTARMSGVSDTVDLITNGRLLGRMEESFWPRFNSIHLSVYPNLDPELVKLADAKCKEYGVELFVARFSVFYLQFKKVPDDGVESFRQCNWKHSCLTVHDGKFYLCPQSAFFTDTMLGLEQGIDGLIIDEELTEDKLRSYMNRSNPFHACSICRAQNEMVAWSQPKAFEEWKEASTHK